VTQVLLTNDDGLDAVGLRAVREALAPVADVTVVAPADDRSGCARQYSRQFGVTETPDGWAVDGTPTDCVHFGRAALDTAFDLVVAGCNDGPNVGAHRLGQSGTVAAAVQAGFLGLPGVAVSVFDPPTGVRGFDPDDYREAGRLARFLVDRIAETGLPPGVDFLNCNVPATASDPPLRVTEPVHDFDVRLQTADANPDTETADGATAYRLFDAFYDPLVPDNGVPQTDPPGTDRGAIRREVVSVSPLSVGYQTRAPTETATLCDGYADGPAVAATDTDRPDEADGETTDTN
jgi:5''/3''-nucleotidase SurE